MTHKRSDLQTLFIDTKLITMVSIKHSVAFVFVCAVSLFVRQHLIGRKSSHISRTH